MPNAMLPPGPKNHSLIGNPQLAEDTLNYTVTMWKTYGDIVRLRFFHQPVTLIGHPDYAKHVLQDHHQNYDKNISVIKNLGVLLGNGLFTSDGDLWRRQRSSIQPIFQRKHLPGLANIAQESIQLLVSQWQRYAKMHEQIEMTNENMLFTMDTISRTLFSAPLGTKAQEIEAYMDEVMPSVYKYVNLAFPPLAIPTARNRTIKAGIGKIDAMIYEIIAYYRKNKPDSQDLLALLLAAREEQEDPLDDQQIHDELMTFLLGGHDTTARTLTWIWYVLATHPEVEEKLHQEVDQVLQGKPPTFEDMSRLPYLQIFVQEILRFYPPAFIIARHTKEKDVIAGYNIPANSMALVMPYIIHRHPDFWEEPESFRPERFDLQRNAWPRRAYLPFGAGPHICIGNNFGLMLVHLTLATLAQHFQVRLVPGQKIGELVKLTLRPDGPVMMTISAR